MRKTLVTKQAPEALEQLQTMNEKEYLRSTDVMQIFSISLSTLKNLRRDGVIPCYRLGKTYLYKREEIEAALQRVAATEADADV